MAARKAKIPTDAEIDAAMARVRAEPDETVLATWVKYVPAHDLFIVGLNNGARLVLPREKLQGLQSATKPQLANVEILGRGAGLHWEDLDVDLYVPALAEGVYGNEHWMREMGRRGGSVTSKAKAEAARANGAKGGRPRTKYAAIAARRTKQVVSHYRKKLAAEVIRRTKKQAAKRKRPSRRPRH